MSDSANKPVESGEPQSAGPRTPNLRALRPFALMTVAGGLLAAGVVAAFLNKPKADPTAPLKEARALIEKSQFKEAVAVLNERMVPVVNSGTVGPELQAEMLRMRADASFRWQEAGGIDVDENNRQIVADYERVEKLGGTLSPQEVFQTGWAQTSLGEFTAAARRAKSLPDSERPLRHRIVRRLVDSDLARGGGGSALTLDLLTDLLAEPAIEENERAWGVAKQAQLMLAEGRADEAIGKLLRELQRIEHAPARQRAELLALLGRAYMTTDDNAAALRQLELADGMLDPADPMRGDIGVMIGRIIEVTGGDRQEAIDRYRSVVSDFGKSRAALPAKLGIARLLRVQGQNEEAITTFREVVMAVVRGEPGATADQVKTALMGAYTDLATDGEYEQGKRYAELAELLYSTGKAPGDVMRALGESQKKLAAARLGATPFDELSAVAREEVKRLLLGAGRAFHEHAQREQDPGAFAESLWESADAYDIAGEPREAIAAFTEYIDHATDNDPRRPEAKWRLAQVLQSTRQYASAAERYRELLGGRVPAQAVQGGAWASRSIVPLAQCLLRDDDPANDAEAESLLVSAVDGHVLSPEAREFRDGVIELGRLLYETRRYPEAIERLTEALERYPGDRAADSVRFRLADSYRLSAAQITKQLEQAMPAAERAQLESVRRERLRKSMALMEQYRREIDAKSARVGPLDQAQKRNAMFYLGDCAFELGDYPGAIAAYDAARQMYPNEPASLVAMVQIVNCYVAQGEYDKARTANEAAKRHMERFPQSAWNSPDMPMEREHWQRWLDSSMLLQRQASAEH
ncbi:MAG: tetratricopeptide repeat protein [Phycisphaeraceae bacterium]|nr:tetratricopeptide repeat protein [Phycisphaeraceae bacterium]